MRYLFITLAIAVIWIAVIILATLVRGTTATILFYSAEGLTLALFYIGFYRR